VHVTLVRSQLDNIPSSFANTQRWHDGKLNKLPRGGHHQAAHFLLATDAESLAGIRTETKRHTWVTFATALVMVQRYCRFDVLLAFKQALAPVSGAAAGSGATPATSTAATPAPSAAVARGVVSATPGIGSATPGALVFPGAFGPKRRARGH